MKKVLTGLLVLLCIALAGVFVYMRTSSDRTAPEIHFEDAEEITYTEDMDKNELLKGVTAVDNKDGDVTDSLIVESVYSEKDGSSVTVVYAAKDSSNNVRKATRIIKGESPSEADNAQESAEESGISDESDTEEEQVPETEQGQEGQPTGEAEAQNEEAAGSEINPTEVGNTETDGIPEDQKAAMDALQPQQPRIYLTEYQVNLAVGSSFDSLSYVKDIVDDVDSREELFLRIQVNGEVNTLAAGTYELNYQVVDSSGSSSNTAVLTVTVN